MANVARDQRLENLENLLQAQQAQIAVMLGTDQAQQGELVNLRADNVALQARVQAAEAQLLLPVAPVAPLLPVVVPVAPVPQGKSLVSKHIAADGHMMLDPNQQVAAISIDFIAMLKRYFISAQLQCPTLMLNQFVNCVLLWLDPVSSLKLDQVMLLYTPAEEANAVEILSTDWRDGGTYLLYGQDLTLLLPRFLRYLVKKLCTASLQSYVGTLFARYLTAQDLQNVTPSAIILKLENLRFMSDGERAEYKLPRAGNFLAFITIMSLASARHIQALSLTIIVIKTMYVNVEQTVGGAVNINAELDHVTLMNRIGALVDVQFGVQPMSGIHSINSVTVDTAAMLPSGSCVPNNHQINSMQSFSIPATVDTFNIVTEREAVEFEQALSKEDLSELAA